VSTCKSRSDVNLQRALKQKAIKQMGVKQGLNVSGGFCEIVCELFDPTVSNTNMVAA
jgi:hypothetical protein